jgi:hypothetical protein
LFVHKERELWFGKEVFAKRKCEIEEGKILR